MVEKILKKAEVLVEKIENLPLNYLTIPFLITSIALLRIELEGLFICRYCGWRAPWYMYTHGASSFIFSYIAGSAILLGFVRETNPLKIFRVTTIGFVIILLPPVIDGLVFNREALYRYAWYRTGGWNIYPLWHLLFNLKNDYAAGPALKIEIWSVSLFSSMYTYLKTRNFKKTIAVFALTMSIFVIVAYQLIISTGFDLHSKIVMAFTKMKLAKILGLVVYATIFWCFYSLILITSILISRKDVKIKNKIYILCEVFLLLLPSLITAILINVSDFIDFYKKLIFIRYSVCTAFIPPIYHSIYQKISETDQKKNFYYIPLLFSVIVSVILYFLIPSHFILISLVFLLFSFFLGLFRIKEPFNAISSILLAFLNIIILFNFY